MAAIPVFLQTWKIRAIRVSYVIPVQVSLFGVVKIMGYLVTMVMNAQEETCRNGSCHGESFRCNLDCQSCNGENCTLHSGYGFSENECKCNIMGQNYDHHQLNPTNECKWCNIYDKATKLTSSWSNRPAVPCNDNDSCTERDLCKDGFCKGMKYSCNSSYPSSSCIQRSVCDGNGTCQHLARANGTVCRSAVDYCDLSERCNGKYLTCPSQSKTQIEIINGQVQITDSNWIKSVNFQSRTDRLYLQTRNFSASCGILKIKWSIIKSNKLCSLSEVKRVFVGNPVNHVITGLNMTSDETYKIVVQAYDVRQNRATPVCSNEVTIDTSRPTRGSIYDGLGLNDLQYQHSSVLSAKWGGFTTTYGIQKYEISISYYPFLSSHKLLLLSFRNVHLNASFSKISQELRMVAMSHLKFELLQKPDCIRKEKATVLLVGVQRKNGGFVSNGLIDVGLKNQTSPDRLVLSSGEVYCAVVEGENAAGLKRKALSNCVLIDQDPPRYGTVNDGATNDIDYQSSSRRYHANWNGFDDRTYGSEVFFTVRAVDRAGNYRNVKSNGVIVDTSHPVHNGKIMVSGRTVQKDGKNITYVQNTGDISASWPPFIDEHSGMYKYQWAIAEKDQQVNTWEDVPGKRLKTTADFRSLVLKNNTKYTLYIRGINNAGLYSQLKSLTIIPIPDGGGQGKVLDGRDPSKDIDFLTNSSEVYATWSGFETESVKVRAYFFAVGSCTVGDYHVTDNQFIPVKPATATSFGIHNSNLINGQRYCVKVKSENLAGSESPIASSDGYLVDITSPEIHDAVVLDGMGSDDIDFQSNRTKFSATWQGFQDFESEIKHYEVAYSRVRDAYENNLKTNFLFVGRNISHTFNGLDLVNHDVYFFLVCAVNNAGLKSCLSSDGVFIDITPPSYGYVHDGILEPDVKYQASTETFSANWERIWDLESRVDKFQWGIKKWG
ncbi:uncharacterized protein LOC124456627 [Xenia sp. Carnegie-2017]|uniref:uncharacterized protein LOC124456627 n=1 Tax=Xenia sp. Carnegie-2017 TaxID=2897299 RepID=UPI001F047DFE|nr:uncharacterized protein LOC124456627 [Xenia sp. Carnegie-2017]